MAAQVGTSTAPAADDAWSRFPGDLLGVVYARIPSPPDRVRFVAVCKSWRNILSRRPPQPALPWLILSPYKDGAAERVFCPVDGAVFRVPLLAKVVGKRLVGFHDGGWIIAVASTGDATLVIVNLFSGVEVPLSADQQRILDARGPTTPHVQKIIFSEEPTSECCILAAIFTNRCTVGLCRVGCQNRGWSTSRGYSCFSDIAFCHGKLYGLDYSSDIFMFDIGMKKNGKSIVSDAWLLHVQKPSAIYWSKYPKVSYIVSHNDKLLVAKRTDWLLEHELFLKVFELIKVDNDKIIKYDYMWAEVMTLDNHALFLSAPYSKLVHVPAGRHGDVERNHIYYNHPRTSNEEFIDDVVQLKICDNGHHMYCRKDHKVDGVDRITSVRYYVPNSCHTLTWVLPPNF